MIATPSIRTHAKPPARREPDFQKMPQRVDLEIALLGSMILDPRVIDKVRAKATLAAFWNSDHEVLARAIYARNDAGAEIDPVMIEDELTERHGIDSDRAHMLIRDAIEKGVATWNAEEYAHVIADKATLRELIQAAQDTMRDTFGSEHSAQAAVNRAADRFLKVSTAGQGTVKRTVAEVLREAMARIHRQQAGEVFGVPTGFDQLDHDLGGCLPDRTLTIVAARPSMGKSAFALNLCEYATIQLKIPALFVSLEMSDVSLGCRMLSAETGIEGSTFRRPDSFRNGEEILLDRAFERLKNAPLAFIDQGGLDMAAIAAAVRADVRERKTGLVVIDYLGMVGGTGNDDDQEHSRQEKVAAMARAAKQIAKDNGIPVVLACQLNRQCVGRTDKRPMLTDLRDSGEIEQTADIVLLLHRPEYYDPEDKKGKAEVIIAKWREGRTGDVDLAFDARLTQFSNLPREEEPF